MRAGTNSIPQRLKALGFKSYRQYLASPHWAEVKERFRKYAPACCAICQRSDVPLDVHHKTYMRLGREKMRDLAYLCGEHHIEIHGVSHGNERPWHTAKQIDRRKRNAAIPASSLKQWPSNPTPTMSRTIVNGVASPWGQE